MEIETLRLLLRPITMEDAEDIFAYSKENQVGPNAGWKPHETIEETREIIKTVFLDQDAVFGIVEKDSKTMIGSVGLIADPKRENEQARMLGYAMSQGCWGKGLMTEAVEGLLDWAVPAFNISLVSAYTYPENRRSQSVLAKCGFVYEGRLVQAERLYDGRLLDHLCFVRL